ncbi:Uma2 family endonuclease [Nocardia mikamii]|uniref:Uma2 family endonuclease n=1 Tax=Nocardia mikamii TaxID=508464 RepID=UPI001C3F7905|nr:Uma2 family endonuclease [Nocardia mikamii]
MHWPDRLLTMADWEALPEDNSRSYELVEGVLIVVPDAGIEANPRWNANEVLLAVEILSPGSRRTDRVTEFAEYAEAGIEHYWLLDLDAPTTLTGYRRIDLSGTPVTIDLTALIGSRSE